MENKDLLNAYQQLIDGLPHEAFVKDLEGRYLVANSYYCYELFKIGSIKSVDDRPIGKTDLDLFDADIARQFREHDLEVMHSGQETTFEEKAQFGDGLLRRFMTTKQPLLDDSGKVVGVIGLIREVTDVKVNGQNIHLGQRELDCLAGVFHGKTAAQIGEQLFISRRTVETHLVNLKVKLSCKNKNDLVGFVIENGLGEALRSYFLKKTNQ